MMRVGRQFHDGNRIKWCGADALRLPFATTSFDAVVSAFLIRNLPPGKLPQALGEQIRLAKPGAQIVCLDITHPPRNALYPCVRWYMHSIIPLAGWIITGNRAAYQYMATSAERFKSVDELVSIMREAGLQDVRTHQYLFGLITLLAGIKPFDTQPVLN